MAARQNARIMELDGLRALLAWWVVAGHVVYVFSDRWAHAIHNVSAVMVFIILSGFVITDLLLTGREHYAPFLTRRVFRLWPAYILALLLSVLTLDLQKQGIADAPFQTAEALKRVAYIQSAQSALLPHLLAHLTLLHGLIPLSVLPNANVTILGAAWSLSVEFQFYLLAPIVIGLIRRGWVGGLGVAALAVALLVLGYHGPLASNSAFIGRYVPWFGIGIASCFLIRAKDWPYRSAVAWASSLWLLGAAVLLREPAALCWAIALLLLIHETPINRLLRSKPLVRLGEASYSTYVFHAVILFLAAEMLAQFHLGRAIYAGALIASVAVVTLVMSLLSYRFVERPAIKVGAGLAKAMGSRFRSPSAEEVLTAP